MISLNKKLIFFSLLFFFAGNLLFAQSEVDSLDNKQVKILSDEWLVFEKKYNSFIPYLPDKDGKVTALYARVELDNYRNYYLNFIAAPGLSFYINHQLYYKNNSKSTKRIKINPGELKTLGNQRKEFITFYNPGKNLPYNQAYFGFTGADEKIADINGVELLRREPGKGRNFYIITFLFIFSLAAFMKNKFPKRFYEFYNFSSLFSDPPSDDNLVLKAISIPFFTFVLINSLSLSLILFLAAGDLSSYMPFLKGIKKDSLNHMLMLTGVIFLFFLMKYLFLEIVGWVFHLSSIVKVQYYELIKGTLKLNFILLPLCFVLRSINYMAFSYQFLGVLFLICLSIILLRITFLIFKLTPFRNIYLFSYLCATEMLPLLIMIKGFMF